MAMISKFESHMTTANVAAVLTQRCTDGDLLAFRASSVQAGFENFQQLAKCRRSDYRRQSIDVPPCLP